MKRIATTLLASTLILTACGNDDEKKETNGDRNERNYKS